MLRAQAWCTESTRLNWQPLLLLNSVMLWKQTKTERKKLLKKRNVKQKNRFLNFVFRSSNFNFLVHFFLSFFISCLLYNQLHSTNHPFNIRLVLFDVAVGTQRKDALATICRFKRCTMNYKLCLLSFAVSLYPAPSSTRRISSTLVLPLFSSLNKPFNFRVLYSYSY